jgi:hypothetical protein
MKGLFFSIIMACLLITNAYAQNTTIKQELSADSAAIKKTALDYVEGFFNGDSKRISEAVHPELVKRIVSIDTSGTAIQDMGASLLMLAARKHKKADPDPSVPFKADVIIYDIFNDIATIKIVTNKFKFIDYAQLAKIDGAWKIINVLWAFNK